jgi:hypothetical protein
MYVIVVTALFVSVAVKKELSMDGAGNAARPKQKNLGDTVIPSPSLLKG